MLSPRVVAVVAVLAEAGSADACRRVEELLEVAPKGLPNVVTVSEWRDPRGAVVVGDVADPLWWW